jgi:hypothetical protein
MRCCINQHIVMIRAFSSLSFYALAGALVTLAVPASSQTRNVYFGDTHLHTSWSADAYMGGNTTGDPDFAYRYALGVPVVHPGYGGRVRIDRPLDFLAVTDHAEFMGIIPMMVAGDPRVAGSDTGKKFVSLMREGRGQDAMGILLQQVWSGNVDPALSSAEVSSSVWAEIVAAAERHNAPGKFSSLLGWEWSAMPGRSNLHRIVLLRDGATKAAQFLPFSSLEGDQPGDLWTWLEETSERTGASFVSIPHNSNLSLGKMFELQKRDGTPIDEEYARRRMKWEPIVEITQVKGDSETHASLSPTDEFGNFETFPEINGKSPDRAGDYVRSALLRGLVIAEKTGTNPYAFGLIGSTDAHTGIASVEEDNFHGKYPRASTPATNLAPSEGFRGFDLGAAGLAAVWAEENTRASLFDALRRKETYATTGPRIRLRFFGGYDYEQSDLEAEDVARLGYAKGVAMGGTLHGGSEDSGRVPSFIVQAWKDPEGANLDRIQIVKGWVDAQGASHEKVYDVALSDDRELGPDGRAPAVGTTVDLTTGRYTNSIGDSVLEKLWTDPDFQADQAAFYYARVLEIPTPRHSLLDVLAIKVPHPEGRPATIQERAYSSPIYYEH